MKSVTHVLARFVTHVLAPCREGDSDIEYWRGTMERARTCPPQAMAVFLDNYGHLALIMLLLFL